MAHFPIQKKRLPFLNVAGKMKVVFTEKFIRTYHSLPKEIQKKFEKQLTYLLKNFRHPSLRCKKYDEKRGIWQARLDRYYRFYFLINENTFILLEIKPHPE